MDFKIDPNWLSNIELTGIVMMIYALATICVFVTAIMAVVTQSRAGVFIGLVYCLFMIGLSYYIMGRFVT